MSVDVEEIFPLVFTAQPTITTIVGDRFFPNRLPIREELPCIIWRRLNGGPFRISNGRAEVRRATFQVESWSAESQQEARDIDRKVQAVEIIGQTVGDWWVQSFFVEEDTDQDNPQIPINADDLGFFCSFCEMNVFYQPA